MVVRTVVFEAMLIGLVGGILSIPIAFILDAIIGFGLAEVVRVSSLIQIVVAAALLSVVAALLPTWQATRISPIEALRNE